MPLPQILTNGTETGNSVADKINGIIDKTVEIEGLITGFQGKFLGFSKSNITANKTVALTASFQYLDIFGTVTQADLAGAITIDPAQSRVVISKKGVYEVKVNLLIQDAFSIELQLRNNGALLDFIPEMMTGVSTGNALSYWSMADCDAGDILTIGIKSDAVVSEVITGASLSVTETIYTS